MSSRRKIRATDSSIAAKLSQWTTKDWRQSTKKPSKPAKPSERDSIAASDMVDDLFPEKRVPPSSHPFELKNMDNLV
jgi:hypothetical protein